MYKLTFTLLALTAWVATGIAQINTPIQLKHLSTYHTGIFDESAAEISAYDEHGQRVYFTNAFDNTIEVIDVVDPLNPVALPSIDVSSYGGGINSIVVWDGYIGAAIENSNKQLDGFVVFFDTAGTYINQVTVGALPDMLTISPDHTKIVVANEGEPDDDYIVDPNGSVSIIDLTPGVAALTNGNVITTDFSAFESYRQSFESGALDTWNYTATPAMYNTEGDSAVTGNDDVWAPLTEFTGNIANSFHSNIFWGGQDLENGNGGGAFQHTLDFDPIDISTNGEATLSFKYYAVGFESADSVGYIVEYDNGTTWNMANYVELERDTNWTKVIVNIPSATNYVRLRLMAKQNGSTDFVGFDDIKLAFLDETTRIFGNDDMSTVAADLEPEYICVDGSSSYAYVTLQENNAYAKIDLSNGNVVEIKGYGFKDHMLAGNGFDASNTNPTINITNWPTLGMYQPDAMDCYSAGGMEYFVIANEGDSRDYDGYSEEDRVKDLVLDSLVFPNYATLQMDDNLGRLKITTSMGDIDADGEFEELYSYGGRSFSIFDANGNMIYDSGDEFEQILAVEYPNEFNSTNDDNTSFKNRSDDKGCEPEGLEIAVINSRTYAFVGLERMGGIMVYDITDPTNVQYLQYLNNRDFTQVETDSASFDLGPEGLIFIPKEKSPNLRDLLVVSNEVSGTVSIFQIDINNTINGDVALDTFALDMPPVIGVYGDTIYEGGISGLHLRPNTQDQFYLVTDRGPNAVANDHPLATGATKFFPFPTYAPKVMEVTASNGLMTIDQMSELKRPDGTAASGIPLPQGQGSTGEEAWSDTLGTIVSPDDWGIDSEGILTDNNGDFWMCDEYGASVWHLDENYQAIERFTPFPNLPEDVAVDSMFGKRRPNRGFEGVAYTPNGKIYAILQSPVYNPSSAASDASRIHRILEIDPTTGTQQMYAYEHRAPIGNIRNKDWKIGDLVAINNNEFLVLEHAERGGYNYKDIFKIDLTGATPIVSENYGGQTLEELGDSTTLAANGVTTVTKTHVFDLLENGWDLSHDKPEGITIVNDSTIAVINDNDYGIDSPNDDGAIVFTGKQTQLYIYSLPWNLGFDSPYCEGQLGNDTSACAGETITLAGIPGYDTYDWSTSEITQDIDVTTTGAYALTATNTVGCFVTDTVDVTIHALPTPNVGADETICLQHDITLDAGTGYPFYNWSTGGNNQTEIIAGTNLGVGTHTITVTVEDINGCVGSDDMVLTVDECLSVEEMALSNIQVYPNPAVDNFNIAFEPGSLANVKLVNSIGQELLSVDVSAQQDFLTINATHLPTGIYILYLNNNEDTRATKILIR